MQVGISGAPVSSRPSTLTREAGGGAGTEARRRRQQKINFAVSIMHTALLSASKVETESNRDWLGLVRTDVRFPGWAACHQYCLLDKVPGTASGGTSREKEMVGVEPGQKVSDMALISSDGKWMQLGDVWVIVEKSVAFLAPSRNSTCNGDSC